MDILTILAQNTELVLGLTDGLSCVIAWTFLMTKPQHSLAAVLDRQSNEDISHQNCKNASPPVAVSLDGELLSGALGSNRNIIAGTRRLLKGRQAVCLCFTGI